MGFNLGAFGRGLASGIPEGSRLSTERQQRELRQQEIDLNKVTAEERAKLREFTATISGPRLFDEAIPDSENTESFYDQQVKQLYAMGLSPEGIQAGLQTLNTFSQMQARGLGTQLVDAIVGKAPKEEVQVLVDKFTQFTPGLAKNISLEQDESGAWLQGGKPLTEAQAITYVRSYLNDNLEARYQGVRDEEASKRAEKGLDLETTRVEQAGERIDLEAERVELARLGAITGGYRDLAISKYYLAKTAESSGLSGIDQDERRKRMKDFEAFVAQVDGIALNRFEDENMTSQASLLTHQLMMSNPTLDSARAAFEIAATIVEDAADGDLSIKVNRENDIAALETPGGVYKVPYSLLAQILPGDVLEQPQTGPRTEALPTGPQTPDQLYEQGLEPQPSMYDQYGPLGYTGIPQTAGALKRGFDSQAQKTRNAFSDPEDRRYNSR